MFINLLNIFQETGKKCVLLRDLNYQTLNYREFTLQRNVYYSLSVLTQ